MNTELFIARRIIFSSDREKKISRPIVRIAIISTALGLCIMIIAVAIVTGFHSEITNKVVGFGSHLQIINYDSNISFETKPVNKNQEFYPAMDSVPGVKHIQVFGIKAGIIKTETDIQGVLLKGVGSDFDWTFFDNCMVEGEHFIVNDSAKTNDIVISQSLALLLKLNLGDNIIMYFVQKPPRMRKFTISGIYKTSLEKFDNIFILADIGHIRKLNSWTDDQVSGFEVIIDDYEKIDEMTGAVRDIAGYQFNDEGDRLKVMSVKEKNPDIFDWLELLNMNVWVILILMILVAGINMISGFIILILERTNMIGVLKALGAENWSVRKIFLYNAAFLISKGLLWGNLIGIVLCLVQYYFGIIKLDPASYYMDTVPVNLKLIHVVLLNAGTLLVTVLMLIIPSYMITKISPVKAIRFN